MSDWETVRKTLLASGAPMQIIEPALAALDRLKAEMDANKTTLDSWHRQFRTAAKERDEARAELDDAGTKLMEQVEYTNSLNSLLAEAEAALVSIGGDDPEQPQLSEHPYERIAQQALARIREARK